MYWESKSKTNQQKDSKNYVVEKGMKFMNMISKGITYAKQQGITKKRRNSADLSTSKNNLTEDDAIQVFSDKKKKKKKSKDNHDLGIKRGNSNKFKGINTFI